MARRQWLSTRHSRHARYDNILTRLSPHMEQLHTMGELGATQTG